MIKSTTRDGRLELASAVPGFLSLAPAVPSARRNTGRDVRGTEFVWVLRDGAPVRALVDRETVEILWTSTPEGWAACSKCGTPSAINGRTSFKGTACADCERRAALVPVPGLAEAVA